VRVFVDTNLWVYRFDRRLPEKAGFIGAWLRQQAAAHEIVVSTQVMVEFRSAVRRKLAPPLPETETRAALELLACLEVLPAYPELVLDADSLAATEKLAWLDALIVEAALRGKCERLYSEDLQHGRRFGATQVINPFVDRVTARPR